MSENKRTGEKNIERRKREREREKRKGPVLQRKRERIKRYRLKKGSETLLYSPSNFFFHCNKESEEKEKGKKKVESKLIKKKRTHTKLM